MRTDKLDPDTFYNDVGRRIMKARQKRKMTQKALAECIDLSRTSVTNIEKGEQKFMVHTLVEIARALHTPLTLLLPEQYQPGRGNMEEALEEIAEDAQRWIRPAVEAMRREAQDGGTA